RGQTGLAGREIRRPVWQRSASQRRRHVRRCRVEVLLDRRLVAAARTHPATLDLDHRPLGAVCRPALRQRCRPRRGVAGERELRLRLLAAVPVLARFLVLAALIRQRIGTAHARGWYAGGIASLTP